MSQGPAHLWCPSLCLGAQGLRSLLITVALCDHRHSTPAATLSGSERGHLNDVSESGNVSQPGEGWADRRSHRGPLGFSLGSSFSFSLRLEVGYVVTVRL